MGRAANKESGVALPAARPWVDAALQVSLYSSVAVCTPKGLGDPSLKSKKKKLSLPLEAPRPPFVVLTTTAPCSFAPQASTVRPFSRSTTRFRHSPCGRSQCDSEFQRPDAERWCAIRDFRSWLDCICARLQHGSLVIGCDVESPSWCSARSVRTFGLIGGAWGLCGLSGLGGV